MQHNFHLLNSWKRQLTFTGIHNESIEKLYALLQVYITKLYALLQVYITFTGIHNESIEKLYALYL